MPPKPRGQAAKADQHRSILPLGLLRRGTEQRVASLAPGAVNTTTFTAVHTLTQAEVNAGGVTNQATVTGRPVDLTYMEYELLRFFIENPGRVWSREQLLSKVWGYDYFGGARTVDVHVRRLRSKLGEERASWITTVRSVGYRFG